MGARGTADTGILSKNSFGQDIYIPRKTYEDRLKSLYEHRQSLYNMANDRRTSYELNPIDIRQVDEQINKIKEILRTGKA